MSSGEEVQLPGHRRDPTGDTMISRIRISRFRGIREGSIEGLKQATILVGRNGAGKSSILEALYLISACANPRDDVRKRTKLNYVVNRRGSRGRWDDSRSLLWYTMDADKPMKIEMETADGIFKFTVADAGAERGPVRLISKDGSFIDLSRGYISKSIENIKTGAIDITSIDKFIKIKRFLEKFLLLDGILIRQPQLVESYAWPRLLAKRLDKLVVEMIREEFEPEAEGLTYVPSDEAHHYLALQTSKTAVRIDDLGDGARLALLTSMLVLAYKPTVLLMEEPELHMHPGGLYTYMKFLLNRSKKQGFQIIASTHSMELVRIAQELSRDLGVKLSLLYVEREDGTLKARSFSAEDVEVLRELGIDPRLLYKF